MDEELIRKYQEAISLLQYRNPKYSYHGEFVSDFSGRSALKLTYYTRLESTDSPWSATTFNSKTFKYMKSNEEALKYFIKAVQNRVF
jgi:hypothetical protein